MRDEKEAGTSSELGPDVDKFVEIIRAGWPDVTAYGHDARFRVRNRDRLGYPIPNDQRGRTGTVITVLGPVVIGGGLHARADARNLDAVGLGDVARLLGLNIEMIHAVNFDDEPGTIVRLSHAWMEPESLPGPPLLAQR